MKGLAQVWYIEQKLRASAVTKTKKYSSKSVPSLLLYILYQRNGNFKTLPAFTIQYLYFHTSAS